MRVGDLAALADEVCHALQKQSTVTWPLGCNLQYLMKDDYTRFCLHMLRQNLIFKRDHWYVQQTMSERASVSTSKRAGSHLGISNQKNSLLYLAVRKKRMGKLKWPEQHRDWAKQHGVTWC